MTSNRGADASPPFPPEVATKEQAKEAMVHIVRRDPRQLGETTSRWTLAGLRRVCKWLEHLSDSGVWRAIDALAVHWKRGRESVHSPDPQYDDKVAYLAHIWHEVVGAPARSQLLFLDELTYYRHPTVGYSYEASGAKGPLAQRSHRSNTSTRIIGALNSLTGAVTYVQRTKIGIAGILRLYEHLTQQYPGRRLYIVQDNWPVHFHPDVLAALEPQETPFAWCRPPGWSEQVSVRARRLNLSIQIVQLPTYASWLNPIEKVWRKLKHDVLHLHRWADDLQTLRQQAMSFLDQFAGGSLDLLRYVGLRAPP